MTLTVPKATKISASSGTAVTATNLTATAGSALIVGAVGYADNGAPGGEVVSRTGDTFTIDAAFSQTSSGTNRAGMGIASAPNVGAGPVDLVVTMNSGAINGITAFILEVAGPPTSGIRDANSPALLAGSDSSAETNSLTNVTASAIFVNLVASEAFTSGVTITKDAAYTDVVGGTTMKETDGTTFQCCGMSYRIVSSTGAQTPTYTVSATNWGTQIAVYKDGTAAPKSFPPTSPVKQLIPFLVR